MSAKSRKFAQKLFQRGGKLPQQEVGNTIKEKTDVVLQRLSIINYKNIGEASLTFSRKINCFIGQNGAGKTNVLDAIYFMSFCHSASSNQDSLVIRHGEDFFVLEGDYDDGEPLAVYCGMKRGTKKHFKRNKKEYKRLSEHIGLIPVVMVSPGDTLLIEGMSEERRRLMDVAISQLDRPFIESLNRYNKALSQRNALLKQEEGEPDPDLMALWEEQMAREGELIYAKRRAFVEELAPLFQQYYDSIANGHERVTLSYTSHCQRGPLLEVIQRDRMKDRAVGYSLHGIHRDDLEILLDGHPMRREGSQGQLKTFVIALKLAQYKFLKDYELSPEVSSRYCSSGETGDLRSAGRLFSRRATEGQKPLLLLDDIFDKLDATRVEQIVKLVSSDEFGQIFITDTNRDHMDKILSRGHFDYKLYHVNDGEIV